MVTMVTDETTKRQILQEKIKGDPDSQENSGSSALADGIFLEHD